MSFNIIENINEYKEYTINLRRYFHEHPEVSGSEYQTAKFIKENLIKNRLDVKQISNTGFIAILRTPHKGKTIGLRSELDALPIKENQNNLKGKRKVISKNDGAMHACGHDGHLAILLTVMAILIKNKDSLKGTFIFIFEEGEETAESIEEMVDFLQPFSMDALYGNHLYSGLETGKVAVNEGPVMAGSAIVSFNILGKGGHASRPDEAVNPIFVGTSILNALSVAWNNQRKITETVTLGISVFHSGDSWNIINDTAKIEGTIRYFNYEEGRNAIRLIKKIAHHVSQAHDATVSFDESFNHPFHPTINDKKLYQITSNLLEKCSQQIENEPTKWFASETFAEYSDLCPTMFTLIGIKNTEVGSGGAHHNEYFDIDEESLFIAIELMLRFACDPNLHVINN